MPDDNIIKFPNVEIDGVTSHLEEAVNLGTMEYGSIKDGQQTYKLTALGIILVELASMNGRGFSEARKLMREAGIDIAEEEPDA